jgi:Cdc6-like AAA superfamily ATPase
MKNNLLTCTNPMLEESPDFYPDYYVEVEVENQRGKYPKPRKKGDSNCQLLLFNDNLLDEVVSHFGCSIDNYGIFYSNQNEKFYVSNIRRIQFLYTHVDDSDNDATKYRVVLINDIEFKLSVKHLSSKSKFAEYLMSRCNLYFNGDKEIFDRIVREILTKKNNNIVSSIRGCGKVAEGLYNLGNMVIIKGKIEPCQHLIWDGNVGYQLEKQNGIKITMGWSLLDIWSKLFTIYGKSAIVVLGYAITTLFFDVIQKQFGRFPILYLTGAPGKGKTALAELIAMLFGARYEFLSINCESLSTPIGSEEHLQQKYNLPHIFNEMQEKWHSLLKSRYDIELTMKASPSKQKRTEFRQVTGSTVAISVSRPLDKQIVSRCLFVDFDKIESHPIEFSQLYNQKEFLSSFIIHIIENIEASKVIAKIEDFKNRFFNKGFEPRIVESYSIIAGGMAALLAHFGEIPLQEDELIDFIEEEIQKAQAGLEPIYFIISELKKLLSQNSNAEFLVCDEDFIYLNVHDFWDSLPKFFKDQYYPNHNNKAMKQMLCESKYLAQKGIDYHGRHTPENHPKKIAGKTQRCIVLKRNAL